MSSELTAKTEAASSLDANPWEEREDRGWLRAFGLTVLAIARSPRRLFAVTRADHGLIGPLLFGVVVGMCGSLLEAGMLLVLRPLLPESVESELAKQDPITIGALDLTTVPDWMLSLLGCHVAILALPIGLFLYFVLLLVWSTAVHLGLWLSGGLRQSQSGFVGTVAVVGYASTASLAQVLPFLGDLAYAVIMLVLTVIGLEALHGASRRRSIVAVSLPALLALAGLAVVVIGAILSRGAP